MIAERIGAIIVDELHQLAVVGLDVALPGADLLSLEPELAKVKGDLALLRERIRPTRILRYEYADDADVTRELDRIHERVHHEVGHLLSFRRMALVADAIRNHSPYPLHR